MTSVISVFSEQDEDIQTWAEATKKSRAGISHWENVTNLGKDNNSSLAEEMHDTALDIEAFIERLESDQRIRKFRRESFGSDIYDSCKSISSDIEDKVQLGMQVMDRVIELIGIKDKKVQKDISREISKDIVEEDVLQEDERVQAKERIVELSEKLKHLLARFARILDEEGIPHKYPVPKLPPKPMPKPAYALRGPREFVASRDKLRKHIAKDSKRSSTAPLTRTSVSKSKTEISTVKSPLQFLEEYASRANLNVELIQIRATRTAWYLEYIFTCKLLNINGEGRGKTKEQAKQEAASQVITGIINRQRRGALPPELAPLSLKEMEFGYSLLCEAIDYEEELIEICSKENHRPPIFTVVSKIPLFVVRCNAMSSSTTGKGKTKNIAKRMAAKNLIDFIMAEKRKAKELLKQSIVSPRNKDKS